MTNTIILPRSVVEQALEALDALTDRVDGTGFANTDEFDRALDSISALRAALERPQDHFPDAGNRVPEGWKPVPVEPTAEMLNAWCEAENKTSKHLHASDVMRAGYRAMLAVAPQPQVEQEPVAEVIESHVRAGLDGRFTAEVASRERLSVGAELFVRPQNLRCKSTQARLATLWGYEKPQPKREPLTDEQIGEIEGWFSNEFGLEAKHSIDFARAIERAVWEKSNG